MKHIPEDLKSHLEGEAITLCRCWILETVKGVRLGFTDHDEDILLDGVSCSKDSGLEAGAIEERIGLSVNSEEVSGALHSEQISAEDIDAGLYDNARVSTYLVNWSEPSQFTLDRVSIVGEITRKDAHYSMELRGLASQLDQTRGNHFTERCQANLGDERCKVDLNHSNFRSAGIVLEAASQLILKVDGIESYADGWFRSGHLEWQSGANSGDKIEIMEHITHGSTIYLHLWQRMPRTVMAGDAFILRAGCDKQFATCKAKFANGLNFRGFPHIPGNDDILGYAPNAESFDGKPLVP